MFQKAYTLKYSEYFSINQDYSSIVVLHTKYFLIILLYCMEKTKNHAGHLIRLIYDISLYFLYPLISKDCKR